MTCKSCGTNLNPLMRTVALSPPALTPLLIFSTGSGAVGCNGACVCCAQAVIKISVRIMVSIVVLFIVSIRKDSCINSFLWKSFYVIERLRKECI